MKRFKIGPYTFALLKKEDFDFSEERKKEFIIETNRLINGLSNHLKKQRNEIH